MIRLMIAFLSITYSVSAFATAEFPFSYKCKHNEPWKGTKYITVLAPDVVSFISIRGRTEEPPAYILRGVTSQYIKNKMFFDHTANDVAFILPMEIMDGSAEQIQVQLDSFLSDCTKMKKVRTLQETEVDFARHIRNERLR